tara:strand:- start:2039 stop:3355 length:1317 start_codon:yes stop_codon:yes gene_type:complete
MKNCLLNIKQLKLCIIGLGYVGLPLAIEFGKKIPTKGFDINKNRIQNLKNYIDENNELKKKDFKVSKKLSFYSNYTDIKDCNFYIVCVPTPVNKKNIPDLSLLRKACSLLSKVINKNDFIIFESTVHPGTTEEICMPIIKKEFCKLNRLDRINIDYFNFGYSPERINPGDKQNNLSNVYKIVSGTSKKNLSIISKVYSEVAPKIFEAKSIKIAESAKIIENCQRDINIAFMNELTIIFDNLNINFSDVLKAASTKWNFINFKPGLVGGHCIGVDPYYLAHKSKIAGYTPKVILSGRKINDGMAKFFSEKIKYYLKEKLSNKKDVKKILLLGLSFKENVNDIRNSKAIEIVDILKKRFKVHIHDPVVKKSQLKSKYHNLFVKDFKSNFYDSVVLIVPHRSYLKKNFQKKIKKICKREYLVFDIKNAINLSLLKDNLVKF